MLPHILLVQFRTSPTAIESEQKAILLSIGNRCTVTAKHVFDFETSRALRDASLSSDGVIFGGSGDFDLDGGRDLDDPARSTSIKILDIVKETVDSIIETDKPFLGICYGHQLFAELRNGCVCNNSEQSKLGTHEIELTLDGCADPLFADLPQKFDAQYGHKDSICMIPDDATLLASSEKCLGAALRYGCNVYTTQFHPELTAENMRFRLENSPGYLPEGTSIDSLARPSQEASKIIPRWCELIVLPGKMAWK